MAKTIWHEKSYEQAWNRVCGCRKAYHNKSYEPSRNIMQTKKKLNSKQTLCERGWGGCMRPLLWYDTKPTITATSTQHIKHSDIWTKKTNAIESYQPYTNKETKSYEHATFNMINNQPLDRSQLNNACDVFAPWYARIKNNTQTKHLKCVQAHQFNTRTNNLEPAKTHQEQYSDKPLQFVGTFALLHHSTRRENARSWSSWESCLPCLVKNVVQI